MKHLIYDIETSDIELNIRSYGLKNYTRYHSHKDIVREQTMLGAAWMLLDSDRPTVVSVTPQSPFDDYGVTLALHGALSEADVLIGHNSDNFDYKKFNTRAIVHGLPPISPKLTVDTLKLARKYFSFESNTLAFVCKKLKVGMKDESPDWRKVMEGDADELRYMRQYNKQDVIATRDLYLKLRSWHHTHPKAKTYAVDGRPVLTCSNSSCQSPELEVHRNRPLNSGRMRRQYKCKACGSFTTTDLVK